MSSPPYNRIPHYPTKSKLPTIMFACFSNHFVFTHNRNIYVHNNVHRWIVMNSHHLFWIDLGKDWYLPSAKVVCEGYVFTPVCDSVNRGDVCGCSRRGMHGCSGGIRGCSGGHAWLPLGGLCMVARGGVHGIWWDTEIWSMSGQYASYWNAFLFRAVPIRLSCENQFWFVFFWGFQHSLTKKNNKNKINNIWIIYEIDFLIDSHVKISDRNYWYCLIVFGRNY